MVLKQASRVSIVMVSRGRSVICLLLIALLCVVGVPVPVAEADDGPSCGVALTPCVVQPGAHEGTLTPHANERDYYAFEVPAGPGVITIRASGDAIIEVLLYDSNDTLRGGDWTRLVPVIELAAVSAPEGPWRLEVAYAPFSSPALAGNQYSFDIDWMPREHMAALAGPGLAVPTLVGTLPANSSAQLDVVIDTSGGSSAIRSMAHFQTIWYVTADSAFGSISAGRGCCGVSADVVKTWGTGADEVPVALPSFDRGAGQYGVLSLGSHGPEARVAYGLAHSDGAAPLRGYLAWDGDEAPTIAFPEGGSAFMHRLASFNGTGPGVFAGGLVHAAGLHITDEVASADHLNVLSIDGRSPANAVHPSRFTITDPEGRQIDISGNDAIYFLDEATPGTWRVDAVHVDGKEDDRIRFAGTSFPLDLEWLLEPWETE